MNDYRIPLSDWRHWWPLYLVPPQPNLESQLGWQIKKGVYYS